ncbi:MAG: helix-turn-helix transcriptional regulator [Nitrospira sp.]|nr:helix-turn-helix transcriptional regulator [Nitrospira sp.]
MSTIVPFSHPRPDKPTPREREILNYIWAGLTSQEIAARLRIAPKTVESHRANLLRKFRASNAAQLLRSALLEGYLLDPSTTGETNPSEKTRAHTAAGARKLTPLK